MLNELLILGNVICAIGTLQLGLCVQKNRRILNSFSLSGSILTFFSLLVFNAWNYANEQYIAFGFGAITLIFWLIVVIFKLKYRC